MTALYIAYSLTFCCFIKIVISKYKVYSTNKRLQALQTLANVVVDDQTRPPTNSPSAVQSESEDVSEGANQTATSFNICITINDDQQEHLVHGYIRKYIQNIPDNISSVCMKYYYNIRENYRNNKINSFLSIFGGCYLKMTNAANTRFLCPSVFFWLNLGAQAPLATGGCELNHRWTSKKIQVTLYGNAGNLIVFINTITHKRHSITFTFLRQSTVYVHCVVSFFLCFVSTACLPISTSCFNFVHRKFDKFHRVLGYTQTVTHIQILLILRKVPYAIYRW